MKSQQSYALTKKDLILLFSVLAISTTSLLLLALLRLAQILPPPTPTTTNTDRDTTVLTRPPRPPPSPTNPTHLLVVLGSGGHTAEMLNILSTLPSLTQTFTRRTYLISSGDSFSAIKATEFEKGLTTSSTDEHKTTTPLDSTYSIVTVRRARRVHQSFLSTPITALLSLWDCIAVLRGSHRDLNSKTNKSKPSHVYPDLIMTNGPGTGVCVVIAALLLRFFGFSGPQTASTTKTTQGPPSAQEPVEGYAGRGQMRTVFIESWARVKTLSLSGKILRPIVNRFLVQWPQLAEILGEGVEYIGPLVS